MTATKVLASRRFDLLQIFRGWAALLVILVHASGISSEKHGTPFLGGFFAMGNAGVDFFFVLSGFLIFHIHRQDFGKPERLRIYLRKRFVRIFPIYWVVSLLVIPAYFLVSHFGQGDETRPSVIFNSIFLLPMERSPILVAGWSLRHEILFYFWLALLIGIRRRWARPIIATWIVGVLVSVWLSLGTVHRFSNPVMHLLWWPQNIEFIMGCVAAFIMPELPTRVFTRPFCIALLIGSLLGFLATGFFSGPLLSLARSEHVLLFGSLSFVIVVTSTHIDNNEFLGTSIRNALPFRFSCYLGNASYSIYLLHGPTLSILFKIADACGIMTTPGGLWVTPIAFALAVSVGCLFHSCVEQPLLGLLGRVRAQQPVS